MWLQVSSGHEQPDKQQTNTCVCTPLSLPVSRFTITSPEKCALNCYMLGFMGTAGSENSDECWCSKESGPVGKGVPSSTCNKHCTTNLSQSCGGNSRLSEYSFQCHKDTQLYSCVEGTSVEDPQGAWTDPNCDNACTGPSLPPSPPAPTPSPPSPTPPCPPAPPAPTPCCPPCPSCDQGLWHVPGAGNPPAEICMSIHALLAIILGCVIGTMVVTSFAFLAMSKMLLGATLQQQRGQHDASETMHGVKL